MISNLVVSFRDSGLTAVMTAPGPQGPQGEKGEKGDVGDDVFLYEGIAGEILLGHRVVRIEDGLVYNTNALDISHIGQAVGVTTDAALTGEAVKIQFTGMLTEPSWHFDPGRVWVSTTGTLTNLVPSLGFIQEVGRVLEPSTVVLNISQPLRLE